MDRACYPILWLDGDILVTYDWCIEFSLLIQEDNPSLGVATLPGGKYAVLIVEKTRAKIGKAIRQFRGDYVFEHELILDEDRPIYEIYYDTTMEYCIPLIA